MDVPPQPQPPPLVPRPPSPPPRAAVASSWPPLSTRLARKETAYLDSLMAAKRAYARYLAALADGGDDDYDEEVEDADAEVEETRETFCERASALRYEQERRVRLRSAGLLDRAGNVKAPGGPGRFLLMLPRE